MVDLSMIKKPDLTQVKRVLAVQPHYDDNDISVGGTLHHLGKNGVEIIYLTVTDDLAGVIDPSWDEDQSRENLEVDQKAAGKIIGVTQHIRLGMPDAGNYDYFRLRDQIISVIRQVKPDFLFTVDPWTPYEAHNDHIMTGKACAEAAILYGLPNVGIDKGEKLTNYELTGVGFYNSAFPNFVYDISGVIHFKQQALACYAAQFSPTGLKELIQQTTFLAEYVAREESFEFGEAFKLISPWMLHGVPMTMTL